MPRVLPLAILAVLIAAGVAISLPAMARSAYSQTSPWPVTLTMTGPSAAVSGQNVTYRVDYRLSDPTVVSQTGFQVDIPDNTTYVSSQVVSGRAGLLLRLEEGFFVEWGGLGNAEEPEGAVEVTIRIDPEFVGIIATQALEPGTETAFSNIVETQVFAPGTLPDTGGGGPGTRALPVVFVLLALLGVVLLCLGALRRVRLVPVS